MSRASWWPRTSPAVRCPPTRRRLRSRATRTGRTRRSSRTGAIRDSSERCGGSGRGAGEAGGVRRLVRALAERDGRDVPEAHGREAVTGERVADLRLEGGEHEDVPAATAVHARLA